MPETGVVILAGGQATRLPGKLVIDAGGEPLIVRVYHNVQSVGPVYVSANRSFPAEIDALLACPVVVDRRPGRGPLGGLWTAFGQAREARIFVVAGDCPFAGADLAQALASAWEPGWEAVVPELAGGRLEPLCALYDRAAFLREAFEVLNGSGAVKDVVERLRTKRLRFSDERMFANVNTASDRRAFLHA